jgi:hypothetical protein
LTLHVHVLEPLALLLLPGHAEHDVELAAVENELAAHGVQTPLLQKRPAGQSAQLEQAAVVVNPFSE